MSVYTTVTPEQLSALLTSYDIGKLTSFAGIAEGVENTNYHVVTERGDYILTLFEQFECSQIPFFLSLLTHLQQDGISCPQPVPMRGGESIAILNDKPAVIFNFLEGKSPIKPTKTELMLLGKKMAQMHLSLAKTTKEGSTQQPHEDAIDSVTAILANLPSDDAALYLDELKHQQQVDRNHLPRGLIHGDLFRDNCLVSNGRLSGVLDFYSASEDAYILDIAITASDWCRDQKNELIVSDVDSLLEGYQSVRRFEQKEEKLWPDILRFAAFRFWCSRLVEQFHSRKHSLSVEKNPQDYRNLLLYLRKNTENSKSFP